MQRVLVHRVDQVEVNDGEEEELRAEGDRAELLTLLVDLHLGDLGLLLLLFDLS